MLPVVEVKIADLKRWKLHIVIISPNEAHSTKDVSKTDPTNLKNLYTCYNFPWTEYLLKRKTNVFEANYALWLVINAMKFVSPNNALRTFCVCHECVNNVSNL